MIDRRAFLATTATAIAGSTTALAGCTAPIAGRTHTARDLDDDAFWQFRGGLQRHGYYPDRVVPERVHVAWELPAVNTGDHTAAKASAVPTPSGDVVVPGDDGVVRRVTPGGDVVWRAQTDPTPRGIHGTPAIANDAVYVGAYDGALYAFDLETGRRVWRSKLGGAIGSSPAYLDGTVYIAVEFMAPSGSLFAVDAATGDVQWEGSDPTDHPHSSCAIDRDADRVVVGSNDGTLYAWSFPDLEPAWTFDTDGAIKGPVAIADEAAIFGSWDHHVYAVDLTDGEKRWSFEADADVMSGPSIDTDNDVVYVGSHDDALHALALDDGTEHWRYDTDGWLIGCPTVTTEHVLVGSYDAHLYCLDKHTGDHVWDVEHTGRITSTPLVLDDGIYYAERATSDAPGALYKLGPTSAD